MSSKDFEFTDDLTNPESIDPLNPAKEQASKPPQNLFEFVDEPEPLATSPVTPVETPAPTAPVPSVETPMVTAEGQGDFEFVDESQLPVMQPAESFPEWQPPPEAEPFRELFEEAEAKYELPPNLLSRVAMQESGYNPNAQSSAGAMGLMQIIPKWHPNVNVFDPEESIEESARYLRENYDRFGDWEMALAAYNAGPTRLAREGMENMPPETQNYVANISKDIRFAGFTAASELIGPEDKELMDIPEAVNQSPKSLGTPKNPELRTDQKIAEFFSSTFYRTFVLNTERALLNTKSDEELESEIIKDSAVPEEMQRQFLRDKEVWGIFKIINGFDNESAAKMQAGMEAEVDDEITASDKYVREEILGDDPSFGVEVVSTVVGSLAAVVPIIAAVAATKSVTPVANALVKAGVEFSGMLIAPMAVTTATSSYVEAVRQGIPEDRAKASAIIDGFFEGTFEKMSAPALLAIGEVKAGSKVLDRILEYAKKEMSSEMLTTFFQNLNRDIAIDPGKPLEQMVYEMGHDLVLTAVATPFTGAAQAGIVRVVPSSVKASKVVATKIQEGVLGKKTAEYVALDNPEYEQARDDAEKARVLKEQADAVVEQATVTIMEVANKEAEAAGVPYRVTEKDKLDTEFAAGYSGGETFYMKPETQQEIRETYTPDSGQKIDIDNLPPGTVEIDTTTKWRTEKKETEALIKTIDSKLKEEKRKEIVNVDKIIALGQDREHSAERLRRVNMEIIRDKDILSRAQKIIQRSAQRLGIEDNYLITTHNYNSGLSGLPFGAIADYSGNTKIIFIGTQPSLRISNKVPGVDSIPMIDEAFQMETALHEFGHGIILHYWNRSPLPVRQALQIQYLAERKAAGDLDLAQAMIRTGMTLGDAILARSEADVLVQGDVSKLQQPTEQIKGQLSGVAQRHLDYKLSFAEWLANQFANYTQVTKTGRNDIALFYGEVHKALNDIYKILNIEKINSTVTYKKFIDRTMKVVEARERRKDLVNAERRKRRAFKNVLKNSPHVVITERTGGIVEGLFGAKGGRIRDRFVRDMDKFNWYVNYVWGLEHISEHNQHVPGVVQYLQSARAWWTEKMEWTVNSQDMLKKVKRQVRSDKLDNEFGDYLFEADSESDRLQRALTLEEKAKLVEKYGLNEEEAAAAELVWEHMRKAVTAMEEVMIRDTVKNIPDEQERVKALAKVRMEMAKLKDRNYMPHSRFGEYAIGMVSYKDGLEFDGKTYKIGQQVLYETFETEKEQLAAKEKLERMFSKDDAVVKDSMLVGGDAVRMLQGLPPPIARAIAVGLQLTEEQLDQLKLLELELAPANSFRKRFLKRKNVAGYSDNPMRVLSDYFVRFANHYARVKHNPALQDALEIIKLSIHGGVHTDGTTVPRATGARILPGNKRSKIYKWYLNHYDYLNNPGNEFSTIRAMAFHFYLAFLPKAALVNMTQVPFVGLPYLSSRFGNVSSSAVMMDVMKDWSLHWKKGRAYDSDEEEMIQILRKSGLLEESAATEMAAAAQASFIDRYAGGSVLGSDKAGQMFRGLNQAGTYLFQSAEKWNREIMARTAYRLAKKSGKFSTFTDWVEVAGAAVRDTQFEYARFNRPRMMRGAGAPIFVFWQYITNMLYFINNDPARFKYLAILLYLAGIQGLPFSENIMHLFDFVTTKGRSALGMKNPKSDIKKEIQDFIQELADNGAPFLDAETIMHGASSSFGPFDLSGSLSMGRIIPATDVLAKEGMSTLSNLGSASIQAGGATAEIAVNILTATFSDDPDIWRRMERMMPNYMKSIATAYRYATEGKEVLGNQAAIAEFDPTQPEDMIAIAGRSLGFPITKVNQQRRSYYAAKDVEAYYSKRKTMLLEQYFYYMNKFDWGKLKADGDLLSDIRQFNKTVPFPEMGISGMDLLQSVTARRKAQLKTEHGMPLVRKYTRLHREILDSYGFESIHTNRLGFDAANSIPSDDSPPNGKLEFLDE